MVLCELYSPRKEETIKLNVKFILRSASPSRKTPTTFTITIKWVVQLYSHLNRVVIKYIPLLDSLFAKHNNVI